jgi:hypothetical protein
MQCSAFQTEMRQTAVCTTPVYGSVQKLACKLHDKSNCLSRAICCSLEGEGSLPRKHCVHTIESPPVPTPPACPDELPERASPTRPRPTGNPAPGQTPSNIRPRRGATVTSGPCNVPLSSLVHVPNQPKPPIVHHLVRRRLWTPKLVASILRLTHSALCHSRLGRNSRRVANQIRTRVPSIPPREFPDVTIT